MDPAHGYSRVPCPGGICPDKSLEELPRFHFDYFVPAIETVFVLMTGEWVDAMDPGIQSVGPYASIYYTFVVLVGRYLLINLLIAIVLNAFADDGEEGDVEDQIEKAYQKREKSREDRKREMLEAPSAALTSSSRSRLSTRRLYSSSARQSEGTTRMLAKEVEKDITELLSPAPSMRSLKWPQDYSLGCFSPLSSVRMGCVKIVSSQLFDSLVVFAIIVSSICLAMDSPRLDEDSTLKTTLGLLDLYVWPWFFLGELLLKVIAFGFCFGRYAYVKSPWNLLDLIIVTSSFIVLMVGLFPWLESWKNVRILRVLRPLRLVARDPGMRLVLESLIRALPNVLNTIGVICTFLMVFGVLGMQLFMGQLATCNDPSIRTRAECVPDAGMPGSSAAALPAPPVAAEVAVDAAAAVARQLGEIGLQNVTAGAALAASAIVGANAPYVSDIISGSVRNAVTSARRALKGSGGGLVFDASKHVREWKNARVGSFDDFSSAMLLLYVMSTGDEWEISMYRTMDATPDDVSLERNDFSPAAIFSIVWIFLGNFFAMNLFVAVIVDNFNKIKAETDGSATMTNEQLQWVKTMKAMMRQAPSRQARLDSETAA